LRHFLRLLFFFLIIQSIIVYLVYKDNQIKVQTHLDNASKIIDIEYDVIYNSYKKLLKCIYDETINQDSVKKLVHESYDEKNTDTNRKKLQQLLSASYERFKTQNIRQLHFHDTNNHSFLRMHKPEKFGDDLSDIRYSVKFVNTHKQSVDGFEEGRVHNGFRFVFPLFYDETHIGSAEASLSSGAFSQELEDSFALKSIFAIRKDIVAKKVWGEYKGNYDVAPFSDQFLLDKSYFSAKSLDATIFQKLKKQIQDLLDSKETFSTYVKIMDAYYVISFKPVTNVEGIKAVAYLITYQEDDALKSIITTSYTYLLIFSILNVLTFLLIYRSRIGKLKIEDEHKKQEFILNNQEDIVVLSDREKNIVQINEKFFEIFDYKDKYEFIHHHTCVCDLFLERDGYISAKDLDAILDDDSHIYKALMVDKHGNERVFKVMHKKITLRNDTFYLKTISDITELEDAIKASHDMMVAKAMFMANMSHEIRTPMNAIIGFTQLLIHQKLEPKVAKYIKIIDTSAKNLLSIINDVLDFSKLESGAMHLDNIDVDIRSEILKNLALFDLRCSEKSINFEKNLDDSLSQCIHIDIYKLNQVISNLLSNAIKFTDVHGTITFEAKIIAKRLYLSVKDTGIGIAEDRLDKVFEEFTQADSSTTRKYGGTGLGLSISRSIVEMMGGELKIKSTLLIGSTFYFDVNFEECKGEEDGK
jgi:two-component system, sensor histidine kinase and response regulator